MSTWAVPGAKCVCVSDFWQQSGVNGPSLNEILTISEVYTHAYGWPCFRFKEHMGWSDGEGGFHGYHHRNFRPLITRTQSEDLAIFLPLLETAGEDA